MKEIYCFEFTKAKYLYGCCIGDREITLGGFSQIANTITASNSPPYKLISKVPKNYGTGIGDMPMSTSNLEKLEKIVNQ